MSDRSVERASPGASGPGPAPTAAPLLQVRGLGHRYPSAAAGGGGLLGDRGAATGAPALAELSLTLGAGETLGLVGASGCGKSTVARAVLGLLRPDHGEICFLGHHFGAAGALPRSARRWLQAVFQDPGGSLTPHWDVRRLIGEPLRLHGLASKAELAPAVVTALGEVGLGAELLRRYPHELSGGQRQRVAIARALALRPALLVCDEPTSALDPSLQAQLLALLAARQATEGLALLLISHDLRVVRQLAQRLLVLAGGRAMEEGPTAALLAEPWHPCTRALLAALPDAGFLGRDLPRPGRRRSQAGGVARPPAPPDRAPPDGCPFVPACPAALPRCLSERPAPWGEGGRRVWCHRARR